MLPEYFRTSWDFARHSCLCFYVLQHILIVQRQLSVLEEEQEEFRLALRQYMECSCAQTGCLHIAVQRLANESRFILYEFWEHNNVWKNHLQTNYSKTFQRGNVDFLETPEILTTMLYTWTHAGIFSWI
uniref:N-terminal EF-hand calcium binding protein 1 n=1 Tax=Sphaeramia orbicularis TaxID=375764 RepID=A0A673BF06_9TELE